MENNNKQINAIIFDCDGLKYSERGISPYSEKFLNAVSPKYKLAILSKTNFDRVFNNEIRILQKNGTRNYFEIIKYNKNRLSEQYLQCPNKLGIKPEETLIVGRNLDELKIANELRFQTYFIQNGNPADKSQNGENTPSIKTIKSGAVKNFRK